MKSLPCHIHIAPTLLALTILSLPLSNARAQGTLTPPGAPAPTMKTLAQIEPRMPVATNTTPGDTYNIAVINQPGSYYLTTNLLGVNGKNGIEIATNNVTLDLKGFMVQGGAGSGFGVYGGGFFTNLTVKNGMVSGWGGVGVGTANSPVHNVHLENLSVSGNGSFGIYVADGSVVLNCISTGNIGDGINSAGGQILNCLARGNTGNGITTAACIVRDSHAESNTTYGFSLTQSTATGCLAQNNTTSGFYLSQGSTATDCQGQNNTSYGFSTDGYGNVVRGCNARGNGTGIILGGDSIATGNYATGNGSYGITAVGNGNQIIGNNCVSNGNWGIEIYFSSANRIDNNYILSPGQVGLYLFGPCTNNVITRNSVMGNGVAGYNIVSGNDAASVGAASTATSPWANLEF